MRNVIFNTYKRLVSFLWDVGKQNKTRSDAAKGGDLSGSLLFAYINVFFFNLNKKLETPPNNP